MWKDWQVNIRGQQDQEVWEQQTIRWRHKQIPSPEGGKESKKRKQRLSKNSKQQSNKRTRTRSQMTRG